jgi:basic membrane protein A
MRKKLIFTILFVFLLSLIFIPACSRRTGGGDASTGFSLTGGGPPKIKLGPDGKLKVAFIYIGPVGDAGWTLSHDIARKKAEKTLPFLQTSYIENVTESADSERVMNKFAREGYQVIVATSFGYMDFVMNAARDNPDTIFLHCSGYRSGRNVDAFFGRIYQPRYLSGLVAGLRTRTNIIGYLAAHPIPEVIQGIDAFTIGVREVNPRAKVKVIWTHSWYDPAKEREAAEVLMDLQADVIAQHQDTAAALMAAEKRMCFSIGYDTDMRKFAPEGFLTAPVWHWEKYYEKVFQAIKDGTWKPEKYFGGLKEGIVDLAPFGPNVPKEARDLVASKRALIENGEWDVFWGPIRDQKGEIKVREKARLTDEQIKNLDWFVEGVEGEIKK